MVDTRRSSADGSSGGCDGSDGGKRRSSSSPPPPPTSPTKRSKEDVTAKRVAGTEKPEEEAPVVGARAAAVEAGTSSRSEVAAGKRPAQETQPQAAIGSQAVEPQKPRPWARLVSQGN